MSHEKEAEIIEAMRADKIVCNFRDSENEWAIEQEQKTPGGFGISQTQITINGISERKIGYYSDGRENSNAILKTDVRPHQLIGAILSQASDNIFIFTQHLKPETYKSERIVQHISESLISGKKVWIIVENKPNTDFFFKHPLLYKVSDHINHNLFVRTFSGSRRLEDPMLSRYETLRDDFLITGNFVRYEPYCGGSHAFGILSNTISKHLMRRFETMWEATESIYGPVPKELIFSIEKRGHRENGRISCGTFATFSIPFSSQKNLEEVVQNKLCPLATAAVEFPLGRNGMTYSVISSAENKVRIACSNEGNFPHPTVE